MMKFVLFFLFTYITAKGLAQADVAASLQKDIAGYQSHSLQEKLFVSTDKTSYTAGDIMWFKVYDVDAHTHKPLDVSKVSYVEIMSRDDKPVLQAKISMRNGSGSGSFLIPFSLNSDHYILKAYTSWMRNFSPETYFETPVTIINTLKKQEFRGQPDSVVYDVRFFPEGGNLVSGLMSNIAFEGTDQWGRSIDFTGYLLNEKNDTLTRFQPDKTGMGTFSFTPSVNETYRAVIKAGKQFFTKPLPPIYHEGYVITLRQAAENQLSVSVSSNTSTPEPFVYLVIQNGQTVKAMQVKMMANKTVDFTIDKSTLAEGISHFILFNSLRQPLCERLYCRQPQQKSIVGITPDANNYGERKKVNLQVGFSKDTAETEVADLSLSVFRLDFLPVMKQANMYDYLWLGSEIKGIPGSPGSYLADTSAEGQKRLDNLMLTQGWRRFRWEDILQSNKTSFSFLPDYEGQTITGLLTSKTTGRPAAGVVTYLSIPGKPFQFSNTVSDDSGRLMFPVRHFFGAGELIVQTHDTTGDAYNIVIDNPFLQTPSYTRLPPLHITEKWEPQLLQNSMSVQTQNAYLSDERQRFHLFDEGDTTLFYGKPDKRYRLDDYTRFPTMEEVMREYVTEVRISKGGDEYQYAVDNVPYREFFKDKPLVLLDGIPVWNTNRIVAFNPLQVQQLDVVTHKYFLGNQTYNGIVSYITYKSDGGAVELNPAAIHFDYEGLQLEREFYSPAYETPQQVSSRIPDFRTTLFWSPDVMLQANDKQSFSFYTSDLDGDYEVVVQGNTTSGRIISNRVRIHITK